MAGLRRRCRVFPLKQAVQVDMMIRLKTLCGHWEFQIAILLISMLAFVWPMLSENLSSDLLLSFRYIFLVWGIVIVVLLLMSLCLPDSDQDQGSDDEPPVDV